MSSDSEAEEYRIRETAALLFLLCGMAAGCIIAVSAAARIFQSYQAAGYEVGAITTTPALLLALGLVAAGGSAQGIFLLRELLQERYSERWSGAD